MIYEPEFVMVFSDIYKDDSLSTHAKFLHGHLYCWRDPDGYFRGSNRDLMQYFGKSKPTVQKWLQELEDAGYISKEVVRNENNKVVERKIYIGQFKTAKDMTLVSCNKTTLVSSNETTRTRGNNTKVLFTPRTNKRKSSLPLVADEDQFEKAWNLYQYKIGKEAAKKAWKKLSSADKEAAIKAIPSYVSNSSLPNYQPAKYERFKPMRANFSTWLNGRRWEDQILVSDSGSSQIHNPSEPSKSVSQPGFQQLGMYGNIKQKKKNSHKPQFRGRSKK